MSFNLEPINTGVTANDGQGDPLRTAFSKTFSNSRTLSGQMLSISGYLDNRITEQFSSGALNNTGQYLEDEIADLSGSLNSTGQSLSGNLHSTGQSLLSTIDEQLNATGQYIHNNFVSGYVQNFVFDMPESGQNVVVSGLKQGPIDFDESWHGGANNDSLYRGRYTLTLTERHMYYHGASQSPKENWIASGAWATAGSVNLYGYGDTSYYCDIYIFEFPVTNVGNHFEGGNHEYTIRLTGDASTTHRPRWVITRDSTHTYAPLTGHGVFPVEGNTSHKRRHELIVNLVEY